jgi:hypothetical protein
MKGNNLVFFHQRFFPMLMITIFQVFLKTPPISSWHANLASGAKKKPKNFSIFLEEIFCEFLFPSFFCCWCYIEGETPVVLPSLGEFPKNSVQKIIGENSIIKLGESTALIYMFFIAYSKSYHPML